MLRSSSFLWLLASTLAASVGMGMQLTALAWLALLAQGGAMAVGFVLAARMLPNLLFGLASGTLADRVDRPRLLVVVRLLALLPALGLAYLARAGTDALGPLVVLAFAMGLANVFDTPTRQALVLDTTPRDLAPNAMALHAVIMRLATALGALIAGFIIPAADVATCFLAAMGVFGVASLLTSAIRSTHPALASPAAERPGFARALSEAAMLTVHAAEVRTLLLAAVACEIFGFSYLTAVPVVARDVLGAGAEGLGTLNAAASMGGAVAVVLLTLVPGRVPRQPILALVFVVFGAGLLALAPSPTLALAAAALVVVGACAASFDVLQQTLMQLAVPESQRGRAVGLWVLGVGSGPIGSLEMGALGAGVGVQTALVINGALVVVAAVALIVTTPAYRQARSQLRPAE